MGKLKDSMLAKIDAMDDLSTLGQLTNAAGGSNDPIGTLIQGADSADVPISTVAVLTGLPLVEADPLRDLTKDTTTTVFLYNPRANEQAVHYNLGEYPYTMNAGENQSLPASYVCSFDSGDGTGAKRYTLGRGAYRWSLTDSGWDLGSVKCKVTIDNTGYDEDFHLLVDNQDDVVGAGRSVSYTSDLPLSVVFDRGDGGPPAHKLLFEGEHRVAIDVRRQRVDLFDPDTMGASGDSRLAGREESAKGGRNGGPGQSGGDRGTNDRQREIQRLLERLKNKG